MAHLFPPYLFLIGLSLLCFSAFAQPSLSEPEMVWVEGGSFEMGDAKGLSNERPAHIVQLRSFSIARYEVTQLLWMQVMGSNPSFFKNCDNCPVEEVTPAQIDSFIARLQSLSGKKYRLPTEAEWEYAALGGRQSKGYRYPGSNRLAEVAWMKDNAEERTHPVGLKKPNELGLYDMAGNVWELCRDYWNPAYYKKSPTTNPCNETKAIFRAARGGSWRSGEERCYSKARNRNVPDHHK